MFNNKFRKHHFAPGPMDYMKNKIERLRANLEVIEQAGTAEPLLPLSEPVPDPNQAPIRTSQMGTHTETMQKSDTRADDLLCVPDSPLLPLNHKESYLAEPRTTNQLLWYMRQPITILWLTGTIFIASSTALAILNRYSLYQATYKFPYPLSHVFSQLVFCELAILLMMLIPRILLHIRPQLSGSVPVVENIAWDTAAFTALFPVSASYFIASAAFIYCLNYVPMNHAVLVLSPTMICQLALSKYFLPDSTQSMYIAASCIMLMIGHAMASLSSTSPGMPGFNFQGLLAGLVTSVALPIYNCLVKKNLPRVNHNPIQLLHYIVVSCIVMCLPPLVVTGEIFDVFTKCFFLDEGGFWVLMLVLGLLGVLACISQFLLLTYTSPLTMVVLSFAKNALIQIPFAEWLNKSSLTWFNHVGLLLSFLSVCSYLYLVNLHRPKFGLQWRT